MGSTNGKPGLAKEDIINFVKITGMNEDQVEKFFVRINEVKVSFTGHPVILNLIQIKETFDDFTKDHPSGKIDRSQFESSMAKVNSRVDIISTS